MISKRPKLQRQKKIFKQGTPRATQMNINIVTWGRWLKQSSRTPSRPNISAISTENISVMSLVSERIIRNYNVFFLG